MIALAQAAPRAAARFVAPPRRLALTALALVLAASPAGAQVPDKFTNLKFFPKDIARADLVEAMRGFSFALGVRCEHCHAGAGGADLRLDFASDEKEPKKTARLMLEMVRAINGDHIGKLGAQAVRVECYTCHHGVKTPKRLDNLLYDIVEEKGLPAALAELDTLRERYYGSGAYDFGESQLNIAAFRLGRANKFDEAMAVLRLNEELYPNSSGMYVFRGNVLLMKADTAGAAAAYREAIRRDTTNNEAKGRLRDIGRPPL